MRTALNEALQVFRSNAAGATKRAVAEVLARFGGGYEDPREAEAKEIAARAKAK